MDNKMKISRRNAALTLTLLFAAVAFLTAVPASADAISETAEGSYMGTIPAASSPGIEMTLILGRHGGRTAYKLIENYIGEDREPFYTKGYAESDGENVIKLVGKDEDRRFYVGGGKVQLLGPDETEGRADSDYTLRKVPVFEDGKLRIYADPATLKESEEGGRKYLTFSAVVNFKEPQNGGMRSLKATVKADAEDGAYTMIQIVRYNGEYTTGSEVEGADRLKGAFKKGSAICRLIANLAER